LIVRMIRENDMRLEFWVCRIVFIEGNRVTRR